MRGKALFFTIAVLLRSVAGADSGPLSGPWLRYEAAPEFQVSPGGKVWPVVWYLENRAHDPDSLEWVSWSPLMSNGVNFGVVVQFRTRNAFGALVLEDRVFFLDRSGRVLAYR